MTLTAADIKKDIKEKNVTFLRLMFTDIAGTLKNVEIPATDEQLEKVLSNKAMFDGSSIEGLFASMNQICSCTQILILGLFPLGWRKRCCCWFDL